SSCPLVNVAASSPVLVTVRNQLIPSDTAIGLTGPVESCAVRSGCRTVTVAAQPLLASLLSTNRLSGSTVHVPPGRGLMYGSVPLGVAATSTVNDELSSSVTVAPGATHDSWDETMEQLRLAGLDTLDTLISDGVP